jgi:hypothetical protein
MKNRAVGHTILLIALSSVCLISCGQKRPQITDAVALRQDCSILCQKFPVDKTPTNVPHFERQHELGIREIPENNWSRSIAALHPYLVCTYDAGVQIWIRWGRQRGNTMYYYAYYIPMNSDTPPPGHNATNRFVFEKIEWEGIYRLTAKL